VSSKFELNYSVIDPHSGQDKQIISFKNMLIAQKYFLDASLIWVGNLGTSLSYRVAPNWYASVEAQYESEFETKVGQERWSLFIGPSIHYGSKAYWLTATWFPQIMGGREKFAEQDNQNLHLIEKPRMNFA
jgi:hypothetical protein